MNLRPSRTEEPDVNLTPLIDVVFLLLIFFMVTTTFNKNTELNIELPSASGEDAKVVKTKLEIGIDSEGHFALNNQRLLNDKIETLKRAMKKIAGDNRQIPLIISADGKTPHQAVVTAMDAARQLGFSHLTFATKLPAENK